MRKMTRHSLASSLMCQITFPIAHCVRSAQGTRAVGRPFVLCTVAIRRHLLLCDERRQSRSRGSLLKGEKMVMSKVEKEAEVAMANLRMSAAGCRGFHTGQKAGMQGREIGLGFPRDGLY